MPRETRRRSAKFLWQSLQSAELLKRSSCSALLSGIKPPTRSKLNVMERRGAPVRRMAKDCSFRIRRPSKEKNCNLVHARKINRKVCSISFPKHRYTDLTNEELGYTQKTRAFVPSNLILQETSSCISVLTGSI